MEVIKPKQKNKMLSKFKLLRSYLKNEIINYLNLFHKLLLFKVSKSMIKDQLNIETFKILSFIVCLNRKHIDDSIKFFDDY